MAHSRWWGVLGTLSLASALAAAGCAQGGVAGEPEAPGSSAAPVAEGEVDEAHGPGRGRHGGPAALLRVALHELTLTDEQQGKIKEALRGLREGAGERGPGQPALTALAAGVRAGRVDEAAVSARLTEASTRADQGRARLASALQTLHATLTSEQRKQLVDAVAARADERGHHRGKPRHGEARGDRGPLAHLLRGVELRDDQQAHLDKILQANRPAQPEGHQRGPGHDAQARLAAFAADTFDARAFVSPPPGAEHAPAAHLGRLVKVVAELTPALDATQREALASNLEQGPRGGDHHGPRGDHRGPRRGHRGQQAE